MLGCSVCAGHFKCLAKMRGWIIWYLHSRPQLKSLSTHVNFRPLSERTDVYDRHVIGHDTMLSVTGFASKLSFVQSLNGPPLSFRCSMRVRYIYIHAGNGLEEARRGYTVLMSMLTLNRFAFAVSYGISLRYRNCSIDISECIKYIWTILSHAISRW
jgi:hypothetical protein